MLRKLPGFFKSFYYVIYLLSFHPLTASITVTTTTNGTQVNGYFNETNSISVQVDLDNNTTNDLDTYGSGGIYLKIAWAESGNTPTSFSNMSSPTTVAFSNGSATITATNSHLTATNANPDQDNFDLEVIILDALPVPSTSTTEQVTFEGSNPYIKYDVTDPTLSLNYPGSNFNTQQVQYSLSEDITSGTVTFIGVSGSDLNTQHAYTLGTQASNEKQTGGTRTVNLTGQISNTDLDHDNTYDLNIVITDAAGNSWGGTWWTSRYYDSQAPTVLSASSTKANGTYGIGENIPYTVTFSENVSTSGANLLVTFDTGATDSKSISNSSTTSGTYTVTEDETSTDLTISLLSITGSMVDAAGNSMSDFDIPAGSNIADSKALVIDGVKSTISSVTSTSSDGTYGLGSSINVTVNFSEEVTLSGGDLVVKLETGTNDRTVTITSISASATASGTYTVQSEDASSDLEVQTITTTGTVTDGAGNSMSNFNVPDLQNIDDSKAIVVETTAPTISSVSSISDDGKYKIGDDINIKVNFSEVVTLAGGNLVVTLETGDTDQTVTISSISSATSGSGTYTVIEGDGSSDLSVFDISLDAGTLSDAAGNNMSDFDIPGASNLNDNKAIIVDGTRPTVTQVSSSTANDTYVAGDNVNITITFSEAVTLSGGTLDVLLETGTTDRTVNITAFSNSVSASGTYTVQEDDESSDLALSSIALGAGASLVDASAGNAISSFAVPVGQSLSDLKNIVIDGVLPTVTGVTSTSINGYKKIGDQVNITVNFSDAVTLSGGNFIVTLETGTADRPVTITTISNATTASGTYTVQSDDESSDLSVNTITISGGTLDDANGNAMTSPASIPSGSNLDDSKAIVVDGIVPTDFIVTSITPTGGNVVTAPTRYWNSTNTGVDVVVPLESDDGSLVGGEVLVQAKVDANSYEPLDSTNIQQSGVTAGSTSLSITATTLEALSGFTDGGVVSFIAIITDVAGNSTTGTVCPQTLTIDETVPTVTSVTSTSAVDTYKEGDDVYVTINFSENVTLSGGGLSITLNTSQTVTVAEADISGTNNGTATYTVQSGDATDALDVSSITVSSGGELIDAAGNPMTDPYSTFTGINLSDSKTIGIDGIAPTGYTLGSVTTTGGNVVSGYWNSTNTGISVIVPLDDTDNSIVNGVVQLKGKLTTQGSYSNVGTAKTISSSDKTNGTKTVTATAADLGSLISTQGGIIQFIVTVADEPGNTTDYTVSDSTLEVDTVLPTTQTVSTVTTTGENTINGYWNSTNTGVSIIVPLEGSDNTLENGTVQLRAETDGVFENLGAPLSITGQNLSDNSITVTADSGGTDSTDIEELNGFGNGDVLEFRAIVTDVAGNSRTFTKSVATLTVDQTRPAISNVTGTNENGYYKVDDAITVRITTDKSVTITGNPYITLETGTTDRNATFNTGSPGSTLDFVYTVTSSDTSSDLNYKSVSAFNLNNSTIIDVAGNNLDTALPLTTAANSLAGNKDIIVDGIVPSVNTIADIIITGGSIVAGYWNSTNTGVDVEVPLESADASLSGGTIQLVADEGGGTFENLGPEVPINADSLTGGQQTISIPAQGTDNTDFEEIDSGLADGDVVTIKAAITDIAGNSTTGNISLTSLTVDQTAPTDFTVSTVQPVGGTSTAGYWNSTNNSVNVTVPLESGDASLIGGTIRLRVKAGANGSLKNVGEIFTATDSEVLNNGYIIVTADSGGTDSLDIEELPDFAEDIRLYFNATITDVAGNSTIGTESSTSLRIDQAVPVVNSVVSSPSTGYFMEDDTISVHVVTSEDVNISLTPTITLEVGILDADANYISGSGSDTITFQYIVGATDTSSDLSYTTNTALVVQDPSTIRDAAGNDLNVLLSDPGQANSLSDNSAIVIDTQSPEAYISIPPDSLVNKDATPQVVVDFSETMLSPQISILFVGGATFSPAAMSGADTTWTATVTIPDSNDGTATITITGTDLAGNSITNQNTYGRTILRVDNTVPYFTSIIPDTGSFVNHTQIGYTIVEQDFPALESARITWNPTGTGSSIVVNLTDDELNVSLHPSDTLTNDPTLTDDTIYDLEFFGLDSAGNDTTIIITNVTYDITNPDTISLSYSGIIVSEGYQDTVDIVFDETLGSAPLISLNYTGTGFDIENASMTPIVDSLEWRYIATIPTGNNGPVPTEISATDLAGNQTIFYDTTLAVDNTPPSVTFSYENLSQSYLINLGKAGDTVRVTASFNDQIVTAPTLNIQYADSTDDSIEGITNTGTANSDSTWTFEFTIAAGDSNSDTVTVSVNAQDRAGNSVSTLVDEEIFIVDNTPPANFTTETVFANGVNPVSGWINSTTDTIEITVPIASSASDPSLYLGGKIDIQMVNIKTGQGEWQTIGTPDSIIQSGDRLSYRSMAEVESKFAPGSGLIQSDTLQIRAIITDRVGNSTNGGTSQSRLVYDTISPSFAVLGDPPGIDTLISNDNISIEWSAFTEEGSGMDRYQTAVEKIPDVNINDFSDWENNSLVTSKEYILPLKHDSLYVAHIRAFDIAGNISDTLASDTVYRYNSAPIVVGVDSSNAFEDVLYSQAIDLTDADIATLNSDAFTYTLTTIPAVPATIDTNVVSWTPAQADTGLFTFEIIVDDNWGFADTINFPLTVLAVNDTPVIASLTPVSWIEDDIATVRINLTPFASDTDNVNSELSWQAVILDTADRPGYPLGHVIIGPGTPMQVRRNLQSIYSPIRKPGSKELIAQKQISDLRTLSVLSQKITVVIDTSGGLTYATFDSDSNYFGNHRVIFQVSDPAGATDEDTMQVTIQARNDPPVIAAIPLVEVLENDSVYINFAYYVTDVDDTSLTVLVSALTNSSKLSVTHNGVSGAFTSTGYGDSVLFKPQIEWSDSALIQIIVTDAKTPALSDTAQFTLDILRVPRPQLAIAVVQNNAFTNYFEIIITDTVEKVVSLTLKVQNQSIALDTIAEYTFIGHHNFSSPGTYTFDVSAQGVVGDTAITRQVGMTLAKMLDRWSGSSPDGRFIVNGSSGAVVFDQSILLADSTMFEFNFGDRASYRLGNEFMEFQKPVEISWAYSGNDLAIYQRINGVHWKELPSMTFGGQLMAYTERMGYFRLGPKTLIVPGMTSLYQNYPNPFNPVTNISFDIGFMDGPQQKVNIIVYNLLGQEVIVLLNRQMSIGHHNIKWDSRDTKGVNVASGIYFVRLMTNMGRIESRKIMLLR